MRAFRLWVMRGGSQPISSSRPTAFSRSALLSLRTKLGLASTKWGSWYPRESDSALILSPPTSRAIAARSSVAVTTFSGPAARATPGRPGASSAPTAKTAKRDLMAASPLERVGAVGADGKLHLEEQLVGLDVFGVLRVAVLPADLAELAGPVREEGRDALVLERGVVGPVRAVQPHAREPALGELVLPRDVGAEGLGRARLQLLPAPHRLRAEAQARVDAPAQRPPAEGEIRSPQPCLERGPRVVVALRERSAEIEVGGLGEVAVAAHAPDVGEIAPRWRAEQLRRFAPVHLGRGLEEEDLVGEEPAHGDPGVGDALFAADEVLGHERPVRPRHHVVVHLVDLAERATHLADL